MRRTGSTAAEAGAAAMVTLFAVTLLLVGVAAGLAAVGDLSLTAARARAAADAAALAGIGSSPLAAPRSPSTAAASPDAAARVVARANNARLVDQDPAQWPLRYAVAVEVDPATAWVRRLIGPVRAEATAAVRPSGLGP